MQFGDIQCGAVWCGEVWCGLMRCGAARYGGLRCGTICAAVLFGAVRFGIIWCGLVRFGAVVRDLIWLGVVWCNEVQMDEQARHRPWARGKINVSTENGAANIAWASSGVSSRTLSRRDSAAIVGGEDCSTDYVELDVPCGGHPSSTGPSAAGGMTRVEGEPRSPRWSEGRPRY